MNHAHPLFRDRRDAGRQLAAALLYLKGAAPVILALPRGGVPVAYEVARTLQAPLDVLLVRKIGAPFSSELGIGAMVEGDPPQRVLNTRLIESLNLPPFWIAEEEQRQLAEIVRRRQRYCSGRQRIDVRDRTVIVVDDGIATGSTMKAALKGLRNMGARQLLFAVPVAPLESVDSLSADADDGVCLLTPYDFRAVSMYYADFAQTTDEEVTALLNAAAAENAQRATRQENSMKTVSDIMTRDVAVVSPQDNVQRAAQLMSDWNVGSLPVYDGQRLTGMITDRDITIRATTTGQPPDRIKVADAMTDEVRWCFEDQTLGEVLQQMGDDKIRRLPVLDRNMQLVGLVSIGDLAEHEDSDVDDTMQEISRPAEPARSGTSENRQPRA